MKQLLLFTCLLLTTISFSKDCLETDYRLNSQSDVDMFPGDCTTITGVLFISGSDITDLSKLSNLVLINGSLTIINSPNLTSLKGLEGLESIGGFLIGAPKLISLDGLSGLTSINGSVNINNCDTLTSLDGLTSITSITSTFLNIANNDNLISLEGLKNNISLNNLYITDNPQLSMCSEICPLLASGRVEGTILISGNNGACETKDDLDRSCALSKPDESLSKFFVYPNPTTNGLVSFSESVKEVMVIENLGQVLSTSNQQINDKSLDLSALGNGSYLLKITDTKGNTHIKQVTLE